MFCPNCGTQNPDAAQTCSKCSFHLKSAAAPKFKGTMLMMNQPGPLPGGPPAPAAAPPPVRPPQPGGPPPPPGPGQMPSKLKGTMVGVAPMGGGAPLPPPMAPPLAHPLGQGSFGSSPAPPPYAPPPPIADGVSAFSPPVPQAGVNPLGGTVAADAGVFAAFAAQQQGGVAPPPPMGPPLGGPPGPMGTAVMGAAGGAPPAYPPHAPPPAPPAYGAPPMMGQPPPQGLAGGPPPFGVPPPPGIPGNPPAFAPPGGYGGAEPYGQPPAPGGYGGPGFGGAIQPVGAGGQAVAPYGQPGGPPMVGTLKSEAPVSSGPTRRNALMTCLLPLGVMVGGWILSIALGFIYYALSGLGALVMLGGGVWGLLLAIQMIGELRAVTRNEALSWWPLIVPIYNMYFMWLLVPQEVAKAKQLLGVRQPPQSIVLYVFLWHFALASDLNDMVR